MCIMPLSGGHRGTDLHSEGTEVCLAEPAPIHCSYGFPWCWSPEETNFDGMRVLPGNVFYLPPTAKQVATIKLGDL